MGALATLQAVNSAIQGVKIGVNLMSSQNINQAVGALSSASSLATPNVNENQREEMIRMRQEQFEARMAQNESKMQQQREMFESNLSLRREAMNMSQQRLDIQQQKANTAMLRAETASAKEARMGEDARRGWAVQDRIIPAVTPINMQPQFGGMR